MAANSSYTNPAHEEITPLPKPAPLVGKPPPNVSKLSPPHLTPASSAPPPSPSPSISSSPSPSPPTLPPPAPITTPPQHSIPITPIPPPLIVPDPVIIPTPVPVVVFREVEEEPVGMYEEIEDNSSEIVGFDELKGFGLKFRTAVHPHAGFDATLSFPLAAGVALSYASAPLSTVQIKKDTTEALANPTLPPPLPYFIPRNSYYINAMIDPTQTIHLDYLHRYSKLLSWKVYGVSSIFEKESTDVCGKFLIDKPNYNLQIKAATDNQYLGGSFLRRVANNKWYLGCEVFYTNLQKSGGFSFGTQYFDKHSPYKRQWTATMNTMGDLTTTFTSAVVPSILAASARYNFNTNSHDSEFGVGLSYTPKDLPLTVKARWDNNNRWGVLATLRFGVGKLNLLATAGISGGGDQSKPSYGGVLSIDI